MHLGPTQIRSAAYCDSIRPPARVYGKARMLPSLVVLIFVAMLCRQQLFGPGWRRLLELFLSKEIGDLRPLVYRVVICDIFSPAATVSGFRPAK